MATTKIGRTRVCSCCGRDYKEWKYQDIEGNNCQRCTFWGLRREVRDYKKAIELVCDAFENPDNVAKLRAMPFYKQRIVIDQMRTDGIITYSIR